MNKLIQSLLVLGAVLSVFFLCSTGSPLFLYVLMVQYAIMLIYLENKKRESTIKRNSIIRNTPTKGTYTNTLDVEHELGVVH